MDGSRTGDRCTVAALLALALCLAACGSEPMSELGGLEPGPAAVAADAQGGSAEAAELEPSAVARGGDRRVDSPAFGILFPVLPTVGADSYRANCDILDEGYDSACL